MVENKTRRGSLEFALVLAFIRRYQGVPRPSFTRSWEAATDDAHERFMFAERRHQVLRDLHTLPFMMRLFLVTFVLPSIGATFVTRQVSRTQLVSQFFARSSKKAANDATDDPTTINPAKKAALDGVLQQIERSYGRGSILKLGDAEGMRVESIGSGALTLGEYRTLGIIVCVFAKNIALTCIVTTQKMPLWEAATQREELLRFMDRKVVGKRRSHCTL